MIVGTLNNSERYYAMGERIQKALEFLKNNDIREMKDGRYDIEGNSLSDSNLLDLKANDNAKDGILILVQRYETKNIEDTWFEGHLKFIDIHYVAEGTEYFCYTPINRAGTPITEYDNVEDDYLYKRDYETAVLMKEGDFVIVYPEDVHMPQRKVIDTSNVVKACIKVVI